MAFDNQQSILEVPSPRKPPRQARRRRPDWPVLNYSYRVQPTWGVRRPHDHGWDQTPPEAVFAEARRMQAAWNACVAVWEANRAAYEALRDNDAKIQDIKAILEKIQAQYQETYETIKRERQRLASEAKAQGKRLRLKGHLRLETLQAERQSLRHEIKRLQTLLRDLRAFRRTRIQQQAKELSGQMQRDVYRVGYQEAEGYWAHRMYVVDAFRAALTRFFRGVGQPPTRRDGPIRTIHLEHHFGDGGVPIEHWFEPQTRFWFAPVDVDVIRDVSLKQSVRRKAGRAHGVFRMAGQVDLSFAITWHRLPPEGSFLKKLRLIGRRRLPEGIHKGHRRREWWDWELVLTVEVPPETMQAAEAPEGLGTAAIDLNWRVTDRGIRFGVLVDTEGQRRDLLLPECCSCTNLHQRRQGKYGRILAPGQHDYHQFEPVTILRAWRWIKERQADQGAALGQVKKALAEIDDLPAGWRRDLHKVGRATLYQWLARCDDPAEGLTEAQRRRWGGVLRTWAHRDTELHREQCGLWGRLVRARRTFYRDLAHDLCFQYRTIVLEDLDLRELARDDDEKDPVLREANKYRQLVALSEFRAALALVAAKPAYGTRIVREAAAGTTGTCGEVVAPGQLCGAPVQQTGELVLTCAAGHSRDQDENAAIVLLHRHLSRTGTAAKSGQVLAG